MRARLAIALVLGALLLAGGQATAQFSLLGLRNSLVQFALERISVPGEFEITAVGVEEIEDGSTALVGVAFADGEGVWMRVGALSLRWNARRILRGELDIERIVAADVEVLRRPGATPEIREDAEPAPPRGLFDWPRAPLTVHLREMRLDRVQVAGGVIAAQPLAFDATGALRDEGDEQSLSLRVQRSDAVQGRILLDYLRTFRANTLKLDLSAEEDAGGLVAELAGFPPDSASQMLVAADGPLTDWQLAFDATAERVFELEGQAVVKATDRLLVDGGVVLVPLEAIDPSAATVLGERAELGFRIREAEDGSGLIVVERGELRSPHLTLDASGSYDRTTGAADLALTLRGGAGLAVLAEGVEFAGFGFDGRVRGAVPADVTAEGELSLDGLRSEAADVGRARLASTVTLAGERVGFDISGGVQGLRLDRLTPDLMGETDLRAAGAFDQGVLTLEGLALGSGLLTLDASGRADTGAQTMALDYALKAPELGPVARAYDVAASGGLDVAGRVEGPFDTIGIKGFARLADLVFDGEGYGAVTLDHDITVNAARDPAPGAVAREGSIDGRVALTAAGSRYGPAEVATDFRLAGQRLGLEAMAARALGLTVEGAASVALDTMLTDGAVTLRAPDLGTLNRLTEAIGGPLSGALDGQVTLSAPGGRQDLGLDLRVRNFAGFEATLARLDVRGDLRDALGAPAADVTLTIAEARHPQASLGAGEVAAALSDLTGAPGGRVTFALDTIALAGAAEVGRLTGTADLADLVADPSAAVEFRAQGIDAAGAARIATVTGRAEAAGIATTPTGRLEADATGIDAGGARIDAARLAAGLDPGGTLDARLTAPSIASGDLAVSDAEVTAKVAGALGDTPVLDIRAGAARVEAAPVTLGAPAATLRGPLSALVLAADAQGEAAMGRGDPKPLALTLRATANAATPEVSARVTEARMTLGEAAAGLNAPLGIRSAGGVTRLGGLDLGVPGGGITGALTAYPAGIGGDLVLTMSDLATLAQTLAALDMALPIVEGRLDAQAAFDTRPGPAKADLALTGRDLRFDKAIADIGGLGLDAAARWDGRRAAAEVTVSGPFGDPVRVTGAVPLRPTAAIMPEVPRGAELEGALRWKGRLGDLWALVPLPDHVLDGDLDIDLSLSGPVAAPAIGGSVAMTGGQYQNLETGTILTELALGSTLDGQGGIVLDATARDGARGRVDARVALDAERLDATLTAREAVLVRRDDVKAQISADITAQGPLAGPAIAGRVTVDRAEVRLVNAMPPSVADLGEVRFKGDPIPEPREPAGGSVTLDVRVEAPRAVFVRGRGLDSEWRIGLDVAGTAAQPRIVGAIERIRGQLDLLGRNFNLETGEVRFTGGTEIDPTLDVSLAHERDGFIGRIQVRGTASEPEIGFASDPQVPEEEVLPRALFGRSSQSLSPTEAIQLANAVATLLNGSGGVIDSLRGAAGIDVLRIDDDGDGPSVTVGKNVADGVFVGAKQPVGGGSATVQVEVDVFREFSVDAEVGPETGSSVGLNWRRDF